MEKCASCPTRVAPLSVSVHHRLRLLAFPMRTGGCCRTVDREISRFPRKERLHMPGSLTTPGRPGARDDAPGRVAFRKMHCVGTQNRKLSRLNGWPMRPPVNASPRPSRATAHELGADVDRYSFIVRDLHPLLLAGLPALRKCFPLSWQRSAPSRACELRGQSAYRTFPSRLPDGVVEPKFPNSVEIRHRPGGQNVSSGSMGKGRQCALALSDER